LIRRGACLSAAAVLSVTKTGCRRTEKSISTIGQPVAVSESIRLCDFLFSEGRAHDACCTVCKQAYEHVNGNESPTVVAFKRQSITLLDNRTKGHFVHKFNHSHSVKTACSWFGLKRCRFASRYTARPNPYRSAIGCARNRRVLRSA
jgi:hypothetical protein